MHCGYFRCGMSPNSLLRLGQAIMNATAPRETSPAREEKSDVIYALSFCYNIVQVYFSVIL